MKIHFKHKKIICGTKSKKVTRMIKEVTCKKCLGMIQRAYIYALNKLGYLK